MTKAKVLGRKRITYLMRPGVEGMALNTILHPNRTDLFPKMLLGIAEDVLHHVVRQQVVRFIVDGDARHRDAPLPLWSVAAVWCGHRPALRTSALSQETHTRFCLSRM